MQLIFFWLLFKNPGASLYMQMDKRLTCINILESSVLMHDNGDNLLKTDGSLLWTTIFLPRGFLKMKWPFPHHIIHVHAYGKIYALVFVTLSFSLCQHLPRNDTPPPSSLYIYLAMIRCPNA
jgi:hypothetical protein